MSDDHRRRDEIEKANANARRTVNAALDRLGNAREEFKARRRRRGQPKSTEPETPPYWNRD